MRKMTLKEWFIDGHVLQPNDGLSRLALDNPIDKQNWIPVREVLKDFVDVHHYSSPGLQLLTDLAVLNFGPKVVLVSHSLFQSNQSIVHVL